MVKPFGWEYPANMRYQGMQTKGDLFSLDDVGGDPTGKLTPDYPGQMFFDIANGEGYISIGLGSSDWKKL